MLTKSILAAGAALAIALPAQAITVISVANLSGDQEVPPVETQAFGSATFTVDTDTQLLDFSLEVNGITIEQLFDNLVAAPVGPIHLHNAPAGANGPIVIPFPFDTGYEATDTGFRLTREDYLFDDALAISGADVGFSDFVSALRDGLYYINVHSDQFGSGELRGQLAVTVPEPGAIGLLGLGLLGLGALRRRTR
ncbi:MAG: CHRD domain-containing protein [Pacificimonas sp.]